uniref:Uncharacterized protein n=1 Tax=Arundo donax TaxID=35708 RepID=A0A0A9FQ54_ARUDO
MSMASLVLFSAQRALSRCVNVMACTSHPVLRIRPNVAKPRSKRPASQQQPIMMP